MASDQLGIFYASKDYKFKIEILKNNSLPGTPVYVFNYKIWNENIKADFTPALEEPYLIFGTLAKGLFHFIKEDSPEILLFSCNESHKSTHRMLDHRMLHRYGEDYGYNDTFNKKLCVCSFCN